MRNSVKDQPPNAETRGNGRKPLGPPTIRVSRRDRFIEHSLRLTVGFWLRSFLRACKDNRRVFKLAHKSPAGRYETMSWIQTAIPTLKLSFSFDTF